MIPLIPDFIDDASHSYDAMSPHATVPSTPYKEGLAKGSKGKFRKMVLKV